MARKAASEQVESDKRQNLYLIQFSYTASGWEALLAAKAQVRDRIEAVRQIVQALGGCFPKITIPCDDGQVIREKSICFGTHDVATLIAFPSDKAAAAFGMAISAGKMVTGFKTTRLIPWDEALDAMQQAASARMRYRSLIK